MNGIPCLLTCQLGQKNDYRWIFNLAIRIIEQAQLNYKLKLIKCINPNPPCIRGSQIRIFSTQRKKFEIHLKPLLTAQFRAPIIWFIFSLIIVSTGIPSAGPSRIVNHFSCCLFSFGASKKRGSAQSHRGFLFGVRYLTGTTWVGCHRAILCGFRMFVAAKVSAGWKHSVYGESAKVWKMLRFENTEN